MGHITLYSATILAEILIFVTDSFPIRIGMSLDCCQALC